MQTAKWFVYGIFLIAVCGCGEKRLHPAAANSEKNWYAGGAGNPFVPGYYADPSCLEHKGRYYIYATTDGPGWEANGLSVWVSDDLVRWQYRILNWPSRQQCHSPTSTTSGVWAPSVVKGPDGKFRMLVSVGSEIYAGVAEYPLGPWRNVFDDGKPLVGKNDFPNVHTIDAEYFIDDDGTAYLYFGSGFDWVNGRCMAVRLKPDMTSFDGQARDITPDGYFEGPYMLRHAGRYYLMYSSGKCIDSTYKVQYSVGPTPFGPWRFGKNNPILETSADGTIDGPGHHGLLRYKGGVYIVYHRHDNPHSQDGVHRQLCIDKLLFGADGEIEKVSAGHIGPGEIFTAGKKKNAAMGATVTSSSDKSDFPAKNVCDENFGTRWQADEEDATPWLALDLGRVQKVRRIEIDFEYAGMVYHYKTDVSADGVKWERLCDHSDSGQTGSPAVCQINEKIRFVRIMLVQRKDSPRPSVWEVRAF